MAKRRRQEARRARASQAAMARRIDERTAVDWRVWGIGGLAVVAVLIGVVAVAFVSTDGEQTVGTLIPDAGAAHIADGTRGSGYTSNPGTSGQHWGAPTNWGVYETAVPQERAIHNLEHGGIVIWYQPDQLPADAIGQLEDWVRAQTQREQYKVLVSAWAGGDFDHAIAVTAWRYLLYQDELDLDEIEAFLDAHYQGPLAPERNAGPGRPAS